MLQCVAVHLGLVVAVFWGAKNVDRLISYLKSQLYTHFIISQGTFNNEQTEKKHVDRLVAYLKSQLYSTVILHGKFNNEQTFVNFYQPTNVLPKKK